MSPANQCGEGRSQDRAESLTALLDHLAGDDGRAIALGARGRVHEGTWHIVWTADSFDDPARLDYEIASLYEHFSHEGRVAILRALLRRPDEALPAEEIARAARLSCPEEGMTHLSALTRAGLVRAEGGGWRISPAAVGWVAVLFAAANLHLVVFPTTDEGG